jgi:ubiquinone/menaquinone biosynthesis C-methylase UbiE
MAQPQHQQDAWAQWLLQRRDGGHPALRQAMLPDLETFREQVLAHAHLKTGDVLLDVGTGTGLIAFGALEQVGEPGRVIFSDISQDVLNHCQGQAQERGVLERCQFVRAAADDLEPIADASVDVVTTRSVLIYVAAKQQAFHEFFRVLKPGGRLSIFEPINRFAYPEPPHRFSGYDVTPVQNLAQKVRAVYDAKQPCGSDPMTDFDERDLLTWAERTGFGEVHLNMQVNIEPLAPKPWEGFVESAPNPLVPTLAEAMCEALTADEAQRFATYLRPLVEAGRGTHRIALAYLWASK